ncbi:hypothetical protein ABH940_005544 [Streptacidiphilus sp. BW17]|uniref:hypothetical protein n=1 Tax=Streptacidiphilus sp. BW17 TaxID=3156274 RepID=UPI003517EFBE
MVGSTLIALSAAAAGVIAACRKDSLWVAITMGALAAAVIGALLASRFKDAAVDNAVRAALAGEPAADPVDLAFALGIRPATLRLSLRRLEQGNRQPQQK